MNDEGFEIIKKKVCRILNKEMKWRIGLDVINK